MRSEVRTGREGGVVNHFFGKATRLAQFSLSGANKGDEAEAADRAQPKESVHGRSPFLSSKKDSAFENDLFFSLHQRGVILHT